MLKNNDIVFPSKKELEKNIKRDAQAFDYICNQFKKHMKF